MPETGTAAGPTSASQPWETRLEGAPSLAVRVREGSGVPVVLLHGLGRTLEDWEPVAALLAGRDGAAGAGHHAVYTVDLRGHGLSADGAWSLDACVDDLIRVIGHFGLEHPVVAGHGLGGVVALMCGARRSDLTAVVGIEVQGRPRAEEIAGPMGLSPAEAEGPARTAHDYMVEQLTALMSPMPLDSFEQLLKAQRTGPLGLPGETLEASALRGSLMGDGLVSPRPGPRAVRALVESYGEYRSSWTQPRLIVPALSLLSSQPIPTPPGAPARYTEVLAAQTAYELAPRGDRATVTGVDAPHAMHLTHPALVARLIEEFLDGV
ncbi:alpha/beta fold hydrolase [Nocardiopsis sediminis]|uniref:Alpha/beta fold hydrolase n=1 Tax=Nocardiopsis sediminis TaxID=1778267 RepID=A0ABV8FFG4_9ACTN